MNIAVSKKKLTKYIILYSNIPNIHRDSLMYIYTELNSTSKSPLVFCRDRVEFEEKFIISHDNTIPLPVNGLINITNFYNESFANRYSHIMDLIDTTNAYDGQHLCLSRRLLDSKLIISDADYIM